MPALPLTGSNIDLDNFRKDAAPNIHQQIRYDLIRRLLDRIPEGGKALDYGCGMGDVAHAMSGYFDSIIGVDVTPQRVEWANAHYAPLQFQVCDSRTLEFPDASFDTVLSSVVINWTDSPDLYLANIRRVLAAGGHLVIVIKGTLLRRRIRSLLGRKRGVVSNGFKGISRQQLLKMLGPDFEIIAADCFYDREASATLSLQEVIFRIIRFPFQLFKYAIMQITSAWSPGR